MNFVGVRMAKAKKLMVQNIEEQSTMPFLRGILTRSLQGAGLRFDDAYALSSQIRNHLQHKGEITSQALRTHVLECLTEQFPDHVNNYQRHSGKPALVVLDRDEQPHPFSKNHLAMSLELCAIPPNQTYEIAARIERDLKKSGRFQWKSTEIAEIMEADLRSNVSGEAADRYATSLEFSRSGDLWSSYLEGLPAAANRHWALKSRIA